MKRKVNCQIAVDGDRSLDHKYSEPIVSFIHNHSDICSFVIAAMRISVPSECGVFDFLMPVWVERNSNGLVKIVVGFILCSGLLSLHGVGSCMKKVEDKIGVAEA